MKTHEMPLVGSAFESARSRILPLRFDGCKFEPEVGDFVLFREWDGVAKQYTGRRVFREVKTVVPSRYFVL